MAEKFVPNFKRKYIEEVVPALQKEFSFKTPMQIPKLEKITVSVGVGEATTNKKLLEAAVKELEQITGQHVVKTKARKSIANFKVRQGNKIGAKVTLRGQHMYEFLDKVISIALPRVRDFQGISDKAFDGKGNYSLGLTEQLVFPEISYEKIDKIRGLDIVIVTSANTDKEAKALLEKLGMPFRR